MSVFISFIFAVNPLFRWVFKGPVFLNQVSFRGNLALDFYSAAWLSLFIAVTTNLVLSSLILKSLKKLS